MVKFNTDFRIKMVNKYLSGIGSTTLNHRYNIRSCATLLSWVHKYLRYGYEGLVVSHTKKIYPFRYKLKVLNWMISNHKSYPETALQFNISSPSDIQIWERKLENGSLYPMNKHKSHNMDNLIKGLKSQLRLSKDRILKLKIKSKYLSLIRHYSSNNSIQKIKNSFQITLKSILEILHISRSSYYYRRKATLSKHKQDNLSLINEISEIREATHYKAGYRTITGVLRRRNKIINHKRVQRILQMNNWQCTAFSKKKRKYNSYHGQVGKIAPNLLNRNFKTSSIGRKTTTDVSEFRYGNEDIHHRVYLSPYLDLATDQIISYSISDHPTVGFTLKPLIKGLEEFKRLNLPYKTIVHMIKGFSIRVINGVIH